MTRSIFQRYPAWRWTLAATSAAAILFIGSTAFASTGGSSGSSSDTWTTTVQVVSGVKSGTAPTPISGATGLTASATADSSRTNSFFAGDIGVTVSTPSTVSSATYTVDASQTLLSQGGSGLSAASVVLYPAYAAATLANAYYGTGSTNIEGNSLSLTSSLQQVVPGGLDAPGEDASVYELALSANGSLTAGTYSGAITFQTAIVTES